MMDKRLEAAFILGYRAGRIAGEQTFRESREAHPEFGLRETDAYVQGSVDGALGDRFRLERIAGEEDAS